MMMVMMMMMVMEQIWWRCDRNYCDSEYGDDGKDLRRRKGQASRSRRRRRRNGEVAHHALLCCSACVQIQSLSVCLFVAFAAAMNSSTASSSSVQSQFRYAQPPSKVLHLRNLPWECSEEELIEICRPFGRIVNTKCNVGANRNQAFVEFVSHVSSRDPFFILFHSVFCLRLFWKYKKILEDWHAKFAPQQRNLA